MPTDTTPTKNESLPELPEPAHRGPDGTGSYFDSYTADQMREYALAALTREAPNVPFEQALQLLERACNMMIGMTMDPAIPEHAKDALKDMAGEVDEFVEANCE